MRQKQIKLNGVMIDLKDEKNLVTETVDRFVYHARVILENTPQKSTIETSIAHSIREKIDALAKAKESILILDESEYDFLKGGLNILRGRDLVVGTTWYDFIKPYEDAIEVKVKSEQKA